MWDTKFAPSKERLKVFFLLKNKCNMLSTIILGHPLKKLFAVTLLIILQVGR